MIYREKLSGIHVYSIQHKMYGFSSNRCKKTKVPSMCPSILWNYLLLKSTKHAFTHHIMFSRFRKLALMPNNIRQCHTSLNDRRETKCIVTNIFTHIPKTIVKVLKYDWNHTGRGGNYFAFISAIKCKRLLILFWIEIMKNYS